MKTLPNPFSRLFPVFLSQKSLHPFLLLLIPALILQINCKKSSETPMPAESYLKLNIDGKSWEYSKEEILGQINYYTTGIWTSVNRAPNKPTFYISASKGSYPFTGQWWGVTTNYRDVISNGNLYEITNSLDPEKRKVTITKISSDQSKWTANFSIEIMSSNGDLKTVTGEYAIVL